MRTQLLPTMILMVCWIAMDAVRADATTLEDLRPTLYINTYQRSTYPMAYTHDDTNVENNYPLGVVPSASRKAYGYVHAGADINNNPYEVYEYHYYYSNNFSLDCRCVTHEHDWEWLYIVCGVVESVRRPYCVFYSGHTDDNPSLMSAPEAVQGFKKPVRIWPGVTGGSIYTALAEPLSLAVPRVELDSEGHVRAKVGLDGNAFDPRCDGSEGEEWKNYTLLETHEEYDTGTCEVTQFCYGDPSVNKALCEVTCWFGNIVAVQEECGDEKEPYWSRQGLGANNPLPDDFALPRDWFESYGTETNLMLDALRVERTGEGFACHWSVARAPSVGWSIGLSTIPPGDREGGGLLWAHEWSNSAVMDTSVWVPWPGEKAVQRLCLEAWGPEESRRILSSAAVEGHRVKSLRVAPNPVLDRFTVNLGNVAGLTRLDLLDVGGRCVLNLTEDGRAAERLSVDVRGFVPGIYWLRGSWGSSEEVTRVVLVR